MSQQRRIVVDVQTSGPDAFMLNKPHDPYNMSSGFDPFLQPLPVPAVAVDPAASTLLDRLKDMQMSLLRSEVQSSKESIEAATAARNAQTRQKYAIAAKGAGPPPYAQKRERDSVGAAQPPPPPPPPQRSLTDVLSRLSTKKPLADSQNDSQMSGHAQVDSQTKAPKIPQVDSQTKAPKIPQIAIPQVALQPQVDSQTKAPKIPQAIPQVALQPQVDSQTKAPKIPQAIPQVDSQTSGAKMKIDTTFTPESTWHPVRDSLLLETTEQPTDIVISLVSTMGNAFSFGKKEKIAGDGMNPNDSPSYVTHVIVYVKGATYVITPTPDAWEFLRLAVGHKSLHIITFHVSALYIPLLVLFGVSGVGSVCDVDDVRLMAWVMTPSDPCGDFDALLLSYSIEVPTPPFTSLEGVLLRMPCIALLYAALMKHLEPARLAFAYKRVERVVSPILCQMKVHGFRLDVEKLSEHSASIRMEMAQCKARAYELAGEEFNIQSPVDIARMLYDVLKLPSLGGNTRTGKQASTSEEALRSLATYHELPSVIIQYRKNAKMIQTYVDGLVAASFPTSTPHVHSLHANYLQESTDTGRISCTEPNMQNLPRPSDNICVIRKAIVAPPGYVLITADYEQIELRVMSHYCMDPDLLTVLRGTDDIFTSIAASLFVKTSPVTKEERQIAKRIVYGMIYGMGPTALSKLAECDIDAAGKFIHRFRETFPRVAIYMTDVVEKCRASGSVRTFMNRWRPIPDIISKDSAKRSYAERQAVNTVIQGSAADIVKCAMIAVAAHIEEKYPDGRVKLVCQIHDELVFCVRGDVSDVGGIAAGLAKVMAGVVSLHVPLVVKVSVGPNLGELGHTAIE